VLFSVWFIVRSAASLIAVWLRIRLCIIFSAICLKFACSCGFCFMASICLFKTCKVAIKLKYASSNFCDFAVERRPLISSALSENVWLILSRSSTEFALAISSTKRATSCSNSSSSCVDAVSNPMLGVFSELAASGFATKLSVLISAPEFC